MSRTEPPSSCEFIGSCLDDCPSPRDGNKSDLAVCTLPEALTRTHSKRVHFDDYCQIKLTTLHGILRNPRHSTEKKAYEESTVTVSPTLKKVDHPGQESLLAKAIRCSRLSMMNLPTFRPFELIDYNSLPVDQPQVLLADSWITCPISPANEWSEHFDYRTACEQLLHTYELAVSHEESTGRWTSRPQSVAQYLAEQEPVSTRRQAYLDRRTGAMSTHHLDKDAEINHDVSRFYALYHQELAAANAYLHNPHCTSVDCQIHDDVSGCTRPTLPIERSCNDIVSAIGYDRANRAWDVLCPSEDLSTTRIINEVHYLPSAIPSRATTAELGFGLPSEDDVDVYMMLLRVVVDSGAAWTAIRRDLVERLLNGKSLDEVLTPTTMSFHGVTGDRLRVLGSVTLLVCVGSMRLNTTAYVFDKMAVPMLLGTNTLRANGLVIHNAAGLLYKPVGEDLFAPPETAVQISSTLSPGSIDDAHSHPPSSIDVVALQDMDAEAAHLYFTLADATASASLHTRRPRRSIHDRWDDARRLDALRDLGHPELFSAARSESDCSESAASTDLCDVSGGGRYRNAKQGSFGKPTFSCGVGGTDSEVSNVATAGSEVSTSSPTATTEIQVAFLHQGNVIATQHADSFRLPSCRLGVHESFSTALTSITSSSWPSKVVARATVLIDSTTPETALLDRQDQTFTHVWTVPVTSKEFKDIIDADKTIIAVSTSKLANFSSTLSPQRRSIDSARDLTSTTATLLSYLTTHSCDEAGRGSNEIASLECGETSGRGSKSCQLEEFAVGDVVQLPPTHVTHPNAVGRVVQVRSSGLYEVELFHTETVCAERTRIDESGQRTKELPGPVRLVVRPEELSSNSAAQICSMFMNRPEIYSTLVSSPRQPREKQVKDKRSKYKSFATIARDTLLAPGETVSVAVKVDEGFKGPNIAIELEPTAEFLAVLPELETFDWIIAQSRYNIQMVKLHNSGSQPTMLCSGTPFASVRAWAGVDCESFQLDMDHYERLRESNASPPPTDMASNMVMLSNALYLSQPSDSPSAAEGDAELDPDDVLRGASRIDEVATWTPSISDTEAYRKASFQDSGPATTEGHLKDLGLDFSLCRDLGREGKPLLSSTGYEEVYQHLVDTCIQNELVWTRDAKVPRPAHIRSSLVRIPTGDSAPIAQKPYPIPAKYEEAVRSEIQSLVRAGLIEPGHSDWASPVICIVKKDTAKDATGAAIKVKTACDLRKLNAASLVDVGLLGDQQEVLSGFGGNPYVSLMDAAGGFYQFRLHPDDKHKTCFVLPVGCGGTSFIWNVAPYGLQRMPATYSRAMMDTIRDMNPVDLGYDEKIACEPSEGPIDLHRGSLGRGAVVPWLDDLTTRSGGAWRHLGPKAHIDLLGMVFERLIAAGMTLKASKAHILRDSLEVLGYLVTPEGLKPHPDKVRAIQESMGSALGSKKEVLRWLGMVNFYRRFIHRIGHKCDPLYRLLRKDVPEKWGHLPDDQRSKLWTPECAAAYRQACHSITEDCLLSHPDLSDPDAHMAMLTDASDVAAGAALYQWQRRGRAVNVEFEPNDTIDTDEWELAKQYDSSITMPDSKDSFLQQWRKMKEKGYRLVCLGYFSKSFDDTQRRWAIFDKEAGAILMACSHWHRLIAGRPTTVYTDNTVAASIISNHKVPRPAKLQRWGIELGTYLPFLRIAYRQGSLNATADMLTRNNPPVERGPIPDDLFDKVASVCLDGVSLKLMEPKFQKVIDEIWAAEAEMDLLTAQDACAWAESQPRSLLLASLQSDEPLPSVEAPRSLCSMSQAAALCFPLGRSTSEQPGLSKLFESQVQSRLNSPHLADAAILAFTQRIRAEQQEFDDERAKASAIFSHWEAYVEIFTTTYGRKPVAYDLCGGGGGTSRGLNQAQLEVHAFDHRPRPPKFGKLNIGIAEDGSAQLVDLPDMHYHCVDLMDDAIWEAWLDGLDGAPPPDIILCSPPCVHHTRLRRTGGAPDISSSSTMPYFLTRLEKFITQYFDRTGITIPVCVENVPESKLAISSEWYSSELCGTMFGMRVFRHRRFLSNAELLDVPSCNHHGKLLGPRGITRKSQPWSTDANPNMYGAYSSMQAHRGTLSELHEAMGFRPGEFDYQDLRLALPLPYGRYLAGQLVSAWLQVNAAVPRWTPRDMQLLPGARERIASMCEHGLTTPNVNMATNELFMHQPVDQFGLDGIEKTCDSCLSGASEAGRQSRHQRRLRSLATSSIQPPSLDQDLPATTRNSSSPWNITRASQSADPQAVKLFKLLERNEPSTALSNDATESRPTPRDSLVAARAHAHAKYSIGLDERLYCNTSQGPRLFVPVQQRYALLRAYHVLPEPPSSGHRDASRLLDVLTKHYYWDNISRDCDLFVSACEPCNARRLFGGVKTRYHSRDDPPFPFHTLCIDYKHAPRISPSGGYRYILVVVCALTRFTLYIPAKTLTAHETLELLASHVFSIFSRPHVIVCDNGSEFHNEGMELMSNYVGLRCVHVLPYSAFANGQAEQGVARISRLLHKHTRYYKEWDKALPQLQNALNSVRHTVTGISPFEAVFGRVPTSIAELEDPLLAPAETSGDMFVDSLRSRLYAAWLAVRNASRTIRDNAVKRANLHRVDVQSKVDITPGSWVMLKHGSDQQMHQLRKHGYATSRKYRVKALKGHKVLLEVPEGESILEEVHIDRVRPIPAAWWISDDGSTLSGRFEPIAPTIAAANGNPLEVGGKLPDDYQDDGSDFYVAAAILAARPVVQKKGTQRRTGRVKWEYLVHYEGYRDPDWQTESTLADASADIQQGMTRARTQYISENGDPLAPARVAVPLETAPLRPDVSGPIEDDFTDDDDEPKTLPATVWDRPSVRRAPRNRSEAREAQEQAKQAAQQRSTASKVQATMNHIFSLLLHLPF